MESWWLIRLDDQKDHRILSSSWFAIDYFKLLKIPIWIQLQEWVLKCSLELRKIFKTAENVLVEERLLNDIIGSYDPKNDSGDIKTVSSKKLSLESPAAIYTLKNLFFVAIFYARPESVIFGSSGLITGKTMSQQSQRTFRTHAIISSYQT